MRGFNQSQETASIRIARIGVGDLLPYLHNLVQVAGHLIVIGGFIGVSNFNVDQMERAQRIAPITSLQPPYSLIAPEVQNAILSYALAQKMGVIVYSPMGSGLLTGAMTRQRMPRCPTTTGGRTVEFLGARACRKIARSWQESWRQSGRGGDRVGAEEPCRDRGDRRPCPPATGQACQPKNKAAPIELTETLNSLGFSEFCTWPTGCTWRIDDVAAVKASVTRKSIS